MVMSDIVVFMTQDAVPASDTLLEKLIEPLKEEKTIAAYARQLPKSNASKQEKLDRSINYPEQSEWHTRTK